MPYKNVEDKRKWQNNYSKTINGIIKAYRNSSRRRNLEFNLTKDFFAKNWGKNCYYCGDKIKTIGLDRVDNNIGYIESNIVLCCCWCNRMKLNFSRRNFINHCNKIITNAKTNSNGD